VPARGTADVARTFYRVRFGHPVCLYAVASAYALRSAGCSAAKTPLGRGLGVTAMILWGGSRLGCLYCVIQLSRNGTWGTWPARAWAACSCWPRDGRAARRGRSSLRPRRAPPGLAGRLAGYRSSCRWPSSWQRPWVPHRRVERGQPREHRLDRGRHPPSLSPAYA